MLSQEEQAEILEAYLSGLSISQCQLKFSKLNATQVKTFLMNSGQTRPAYKPAPVPEPNEVASEAAKIRQQWSAAVTNRRWVGRYARAPKSTMRDSSLRY